MNNSIVNKYFYIPENIKLHITPRHGYLIYKKKGGLNVINLESTAFLYHADGSKRIIDVLELIYNKSFDSLKEETKNKTISFVKKAVEKKHIILTDLPNQIKFSKTGNFDIFYPLHFSIELTYKCNIKCIHCYAEATEQQNNYINTNILLRFLKDSKERGLIAVEMTGGEPFLHPDFFEILDYCVRNFKTVAILTNGTMIKDNKKKLQELSKNYRDVFFSVSLHGPNAEIHEKITNVKNSFNETIEGIKMLIQLGFVVRTSMSLTPSNVDYLEKTIIYTKKLGVTMFSFDNVQPTGRGKYVRSAPCDYNKEQLESMHSHELYKKYSDFITILDGKVVDERKKIGNCGAGHKSMVIDPSGNIFPCLFTHKEFKPFGNIKNNPDNIFNSNEISFWGNLNQPSEELCGDCGYFLYCSGCPVKAILSMRKRGEICQWAKEVGLEKHLNYILD